MNANEILDEMEKLYPNAECELKHETPFQLLVAVVLSAQTTDESVNKVTPALFAAYPTSKAMAQASLSDIEFLVFDELVYIAIKHVLFLNFLKI